MIHYSSKKEEMSTNSCVLASCFLSRGEETGELCVCVCVRIAFACLPLQLWKGNLVSQRNTGSGSDQAQWELSITIQLLATWLA